MLLRRAGPTASIDDILERAERLHHDMHRACSSDAAEPRHGTPGQPRRPPGQQPAPARPSRMEQLLAALSSPALAAIAGGGGLPAGDDDGGSDDDAEDLILHLLRARAPPQPQQLQAGGGGGGRAQAAELRVTIQDVLLRKAVAGAKAPLGMTAVVRAGEALQASACLAAADGDAPLAELVLPLPGSGSCSGGSAAAPGALAVELWWAAAAPSASSPGSLLGIAHVPLSAPTAAASPARQQLFAGPADIISTSGAAALGRAVLQVALHSYPAPRPGSSAAAPPVASSAAAAGSFGQLRHTLQVAVTVSLPSPAAAAAAAAAPPQAHRLPAARFLCYHFPGEAPLLARASDPLAVGRCAAVPALPGRPAA
jgi:hypothetical protein